MLCLSKLKQLHYMAVEQAEQRFLLYKHIFSWLKLLCGILPSISDCIFKQLCDFPPRLSDRLSVCLSDCLCGCLIVYLSSNLHVNFYSNQKTICPKINSKKVSKVLDAILNMYVMSAHKYYITHAVLKKPTREGD